MQSEPGAIPIEPYAEEFALPAAVCGAMKVPPSTLPRSRPTNGYATNVFCFGVLAYQLLTGDNLPDPVIERSTPDRDKDGPRRQLDYDVHSRFWQ